MSTEENKQLVRRFVAVSSQENLDVLDELFAENYADHSAMAQGPGNGIEGVKQFARMMQTAFPDSKWIIDDLIAEGDKVVMRWTSRGTHQGTAFGIPATGKPVVNTGISIFRVSGGKLAESWQEVNMLGFMQQLGVIPAPEQAAS